MPGPGELRPSAQAVRQPSLGPIRRAPATMQTLAHDDDVTRPALGMVTMSACLPTASAKLPTARLIIPAAVGKGCARRRMPRA
jgi:hypothetical protein